MDVPQAAIDAAAAKLVDRYQIPASELDRPALDRDVQAVLGAALPHIVAAARAEWEAQYPDLGVDLSTANCEKKRQDT